MRATKYNSLVRIEEETYKRFSAYCRDNNLIAAGVVTGLVSNFLALQARAFKNRKKRKPAAAAAAPGKKVKA